MGGRYGAWEAGEWTPEAALALTKPTDDFLCPLSANTYGLDFKEFEIKDYDRGISLFHVARPADAPAVDYQVRAAQSGRFVFVRRLRCALVSSAMRREQRAPRRRRAVDATPRVDAAGCACVRACAPRRACNRLARARDPKRAVHSRWRALTYTLRHTPCTASRSHPWRRRLCGVRDPAECARGAGGANPLHPIHVPPCLF